MKTKKNVRTDATEYLKSVEKINVRIKQKKERIEELRQSALSTGISISPDRIQKSHDEGTPNIINEYLDLEEEIRNDVLRMERVKNLITDMIHKLEDARYIDILYERYVNLRRIEDIAEHKPYSTGHAWRLHNEAIKEFQEVLNESNERCRGNV